MKKAELVKWLEGENDKWNAYMDEIGEARMDQPGVNGAWSFKDVLAHLTGWNRRLVDRLRAAQRGEPDPPPEWNVPTEDEDAVNAWIYEENRNKSVREVVDETKLVNQELVDVIAALPDNTRVEIIDDIFHLVWLDNERYVVSEFFDHYRDDHEPDVRAWLARQK